MSTISRRSFGTGLEAVLGAANANVAELATNSGTQELKQVMVQSLMAGKFQPRRDFDPQSLKELSDSIAAQGILQPIVVRKAGVNNYEIIAGERRWRAAQMAGLQQVPVIVCNISDESALAFGLIENIQRQALNPIEEASALKRLIEEFEMTHEQVAKSIGRSRAVVSNMLRLLNLEPTVQELLVTKQLDVGHAKVLLIFTPEEQLEMASTIVVKHLTVRAAERLAQSRKGKTAVAPSKKRPHPKCDEWARKLGKKLSAKVDVQVREFGGGKVVIHVDSAEEVDWLAENL